MMTVSDFNWNDIESFGQAITGLKVDDYRFVTTMKFGRLERLVSDPLNATNPRLRGASSTLEDYFQLNEEIQRAFDTGRKKNVEDYAQYVVGLSKGNFGDTPTIDFFTPRQLPVRDGGPREKAELAWPYDLTCVPYDGETQLAARFRAARLDPATRDQVVIVTITHGKPVAHAKQCFGDRNIKQRRAPASLAMKMNMRDPLLNIVRTMEDQIPGLKGLIEWDSRQLKPGKVGTASFVRTSMACFANGIAGIQSSKDEDLPSGLSEAQFERRALLWFGKILPGLLPYMADRDRYVTSSPAIWAAIGALGHELVSSAVPDTNILENIAAGLGAKLVGVQWEKDEVWVGIAVKSTPSGYSFAGGAKDSGSVAFKALSDPSDANYAKVRGMSRQAA
ncbi:MAG TPA: DNA sulfur modification protein DndB [Acetobacteraceae bacterium]|jgi:DNA sulfur modification protein DndB